VTHQLSPRHGDGVVLDVTPATAGWDYLSFRVVRLGPDAPHHDQRDDQETAIVPLRGAVTATIDGNTFELARSDVFAELPHILYVPPGLPIELSSASAAEVAIGSAPAEGRYPLRCFEPDDMKVEIRGGGAALRQVNHVLAPPLPAERLILYEVYVPRGSWSGWPPHCHDGFDGSPYLEETYYFRTDPPDGFAIHRNWRVDEPFDETFVADDGELVLVTKGYHSSAAAPGSHVYFLNFLAGELLDGERITPPCFHQAYTWIEEDWERDGWDLPVVGRLQPGRDS
jgi:5-deoxy-glucuronate isomerase